MKRSFLLAIIISTGLACQAQFANRAIAIPITNYIIDSNDSLSIVQVQLTNGWTINDKQLGILRPLYRGIKDTVRVGWGKCNLIKNNYYYFTIRHNRDKQPKGGDLLYTMMLVDTVQSAGMMPKLSMHAIVLQDVYGTDLYDRWAVLRSWTKADETKMLQALIEDIQLTGKEMKKQSPDQNREVKEGPYKGKLIFDELIAVSANTVIDFLDYVSVRPQLYAGNSWKVSEIFATWMDEGAPTVIKN